MGGDMRHSGENYIVGECRVNFSFCPSKKLNEEQFQASGSLTCRPSRWRASARPSTRCGIHGLSRGFGIRARGMRPTTESSESLHREGACNALTSRREPAVAIAPCQFDRPHPSRAPTLSNTSATTWVVVRHSWRVRLARQSRLLIRSARTTPVTAPAEGRVTSKGYPLFSDSYVLRKSDMRTFDS